MQEFPPKVYFQTSKISFNKNKNEFQNSEGGLEGNLTFSDILTFQY